MQEVYIPENNIEAYLIQGLMEAEGIECEIRGEFLAGGAGMLPANSNVSLWVNEQQEAEARELLKRYERGDFAQDEF